ncbi:protein spinster homolog 1-like isoform X2 [Seriola aureovittata]|uniref:protein spinster homolog 1-like isoform X2 n=2 Tax=Seriola aureovittata TaxID=2871759 RepID=UPI0024BE1E6A|nr:protein spinster homolog 1-like isoform X2 [Seriola aureovittata]
MGYYVPRTVKAAGRAEKETIMAETVSDSDVQPMKPPPKRRRILDPSAIVPVPVYSSKVSSSLQLKPMAPVFTEKEDKDDAADDSLWSQFSSRGTTAAVVALSDSEEDEAEHVENKAEHDKLETIRCPSPPPPESPVQKQSRQVKKKISEIDRRLRAVNSLLSPEHQNRTRSRRHRGPPSPTLEEEQDDDVIILTPNPGPQSSPYSSLVREIPLKIRCRTDVHKIPVLSSTPLSDVLAQLSVILKVPPPRLLLLREEVELPTDATVSKLGLGIADIIAAAMSLGEPTSDSAPFFSDDSEAEGSEEQGGAASAQRQQEESPSGVSRVRALLTVLILCYINLLNYMDRFTVAGVLPDIEHYFGIDDGKSGLLQTVFICSYMFLAPFFGYLGDRYNRKYIMSFGIAFWSLVTLASSYTPKEHFWALLLTRGLVGVGEASYSTIAPTIIADLYVKGKRTNMLSVFYFAIPVGSGLGYIVGSQVSNIAKDWHWALRVTPALGLIAVLLLLFVVQEPKRGAIEARPEHHLQQTSWLKDLQALGKNYSFVLSTFGFTAVAFVTGSLALWAPTFLLRAAIFSGEKGPCVEGHCSSSESLIFGIITCVTGVLGVASGVQASRQLRTRTPRADPLVCAAGLLLSAPFLYLAIVFAEASTIATYVFIFLGETFLSMNWAIVADILLYVVVPTRRSTAEALQIVISHLLGDAGSPYMIGVVSDSLRRTDSFLWQFRSLQLSLLLCSFVAVVGGAFFLATALFIETDRHRAENYVPTDDEPIVVPKSGRSTRVPVSSVLI